MDELPRFADPRSLLSRHGLSPKRRYSQNFLVARGTVEAIARAATAGAPEAVVELGAGLGTLTLELMRRCAKVIAVERDPDMLRVLELELAPYGLQLLRHDAAQLDYGALSAQSGGPLHVAGNLPYAATGAILRGLIDQRSAIANAVLMIQREVRDRLVSAPGTREYGALTVFCRVGFEVDTIAHVPATAFVPRPKVASSVIRLRPRTTPLVALSAGFTQVVRAAFQQRRKTLRNALRGLHDAPTVDLALRQSEIDGARRGETLSVEEFGRLADALDSVSGRVTRPALPTGKAVGGPSHPRSSRGERGPLR